MKLLVILVFTALLSYSTYSFFRKKKKLAFTLSISVAVFILGFTAIAIARSADSAKSRDGWCSTTHSTTSYPPEKLVTGMDYFENANYEYDKGNCEKAVEEYSKSINLNPNYAQAYNNRGYTYMRLRDFDKALADLNQALLLNPNYVNAVRNRADVYSKIPDYPKAIIDYERAIELGGSNNLCGDLFTAKYHDGFLKSLFAFPGFMWKCSRK